MVTIAKGHRLDGLTSAEVERVGLGRSVEAGNLEDFVTETLWFLIPVQAVNADETISGRQPRVTDDALTDGAGNEGLYGGHHPDVAHARDRALTNGAVEHLVVLMAKTRCVDDMAVLGDEFENRLDGLLGVAE